MSCSDSAAPCQFISSARVYGIYASDEERSYEQVRRPAAAAARNPRGPAGHRPGHQLRHVRGAGQLRPRDAGTRRPPGAGLRLLGAGRARARPLRLDGGGRNPRPARPGRRGVGDRLLQLPVGHPAAHRLPAVLAGAGPGGVRRVRDRPGGALPGPRRPLAVQQRAEQHRPAVGRHRRGVRRAAHRLPRRRARRRPGRAGRARRLRVRRAVQPGRQPGPGVLRPSRRARPGPVRPVLRPPVRRPARDPRPGRAGARDDAPARVRAAGAGRRVQRPDALRTARSAGGVRADDDGGVRTGGRGRGRRYGRRYGYGCGYGCGHGRRTRSPSRRTGRRCAPCTPARTNCRRGCGC